jgi:hypothetical protein
MAISVGCFSGGVVGRGTEEDRDKEDGLRRWELEGRSDVLDNSEIGE